VERPSRPPREQRSGKRRHVLVAATGQPDQDAAARMLARPALRAGESVRALDRGQDALGARERPAGEKAGPKPG